MNELFAKLTSLEEHLSTLKKQYHITATELANLKNRPNYEDEYKQTILKLSDELATLKERLSHSQSSEQQALTNLDKLGQENALLVAQINDLKEKNKIAVEHAELIQNWLRRIDSSQ